MKASLAGSVDGDFKAQRPSADRIVREFVHKLAQMVVQARVAMPSTVSPRGSHEIAATKPSAAPTKPAAATTDSGWFHLRLPDLPHVRAVRRHIFALHLCVCVCVSPLIAVLSDPFWLFCARGLTAKFVCCGKSRRWSVSCV